MGLSDPQIMPQHHIIPRERVTHKEYAWLCVFSILLFFMSAGIWHPMPDSVAYLRQAQSFATWDGLVDAMSNRLIATPGYGLLITPFFLLDELPLVALTFFQTAMLCAYMFGVYIWASQFTPKSAVLIAGAAALHTCVVEYGMPTTTEAPFMASMIWSIIFFQRWLRSSNPSTRRQCLIYGVLLLTYCTLIRSSGLMIALGCTMHLFWENRITKRHLLARWQSMLLWTGVPGLVVLGFVYQQFANSNHGLVNGTYLCGLTPDQGKSLLTFLWQGLHLRLTDLGRLTIPGMFKAYSTESSWMHITMLFYVPLFAALMWSWWKLVVKYRDALLLGFIPFLVLHIVYARFRDGSRFLTPMLPVLMLLAWYMFHWLKLPQHRSMMVLFVLHASIAIGLAIREYPTLVSVRDQWPIARQCVNIIEQHPGQLYSLGDVNNLDLQIAIVSDTSLGRKESYQAVLDNHPKWILCKKSVHSIPSYKLSWSNEDFQIFKHQATQP